MAPFNRRLQLADRRGNLHRLRAQELHHFLRLHRAVDAIGAGRAPHRAGHGQRLLPSQPDVRSDAGLLRRPFDDHLVTALLFRPQSH